MNNHVDYSLTDDIVDVELSSRIYKICRNRQFRCGRGSDFVAFVNLEEHDTDVSVIQGEKSRVCYMLYQVSCHLNQPSRREEWLTAMLDMLHIELTHYKAHYMDVCGVKHRREGSHVRGLSKENKIFRQQIDDAIGIS